jgi:Tfp pilus assembly protein PilF
VIAPSGEPPRASAEEEVAKLRALGYLGSAEPSRAPAGAADTRTAGSHNNEGLILEAEGDRAAAMAAFERALAVDPVLAAAAWNLSRLAAGGGDWQRADAMLLQAFQSGLPEGEQQVAARALEHRDGGRVELARRLLEAAITAHPETGLPRLLRGRLLMERKDCAGAEQDFVAAARARPEDPVVFASLGLAQLCLGDQAGARVSLERSLALDPDQPAVRRALVQLN